MKKSIYLAAVAALALTACSNDSDSIFDQSAADRLEQFKKDYAKVLTADGGLWTMEYFSNEEEPGYLFIMKFDENGSVKIGANHKWIGNTYKEETSLWKMIADNGPVLSFNSYNNLFHIFADPANITGSEAPKEDDEDINETGYGHNGDYEFQVMEVSEDSNTVRLLGKKRLINIYLHRLDASTTDMKTYMDEYKQMESSLFAKVIPNLKFVDADGETYMVNGCNTGVMSIYPEAGDAVDQTRSGNFIITNSGIRFMEPLEYVSASGEEKQLKEFKFVGNYGLALVDSENTLLSAGSFEDIMMRNKRNWKIDLKSFNGSLKTAMDAFKQQLVTLYKYNSAGVQDMSFDYEISKESYVLRIYVRISNKGYETYKYLVSFSDVGDNVKIRIGDSYDNNSQLALNAYSELQNIFAILNSSELGYSTPSDCGPKSITLSIGDGSFTINAL